MKRKIFYCCLVGVGVFVILIAASILNRNEAASVSVVSERMLYPGGQTVGVKMDVRGVLIVGLEEIENKDGENVNPGLLSGLQIGDMILEINGTEVYRAEEVQKLVNEIQESVILKIKRNSEIMTVKIQPVETQENVYKLGIWIKDKTAGIGTLTYYDPIDSSFGALGHGIMDPETGAILSVDTGLLLESQVKEIKEGTNGEPGEICGIFYHSDQPLGSLYKNCEFGVFGDAYEPIQNSIYKQPISVASREEVNTGKAFILCTLSNNEVTRYDILIEKIDSKDSDSNKSMIIKVIDEELINECGGIVQGMSGSPIIQDGKLVGAVTHVLVNDPTRGYGIFIENMLDAKE
ncbi:MAG: SpoIVB peptidase [Bacillota bacterium]|nr:SpoIVB peptidase [Bacillota bacterium]